MYTLVFWASQIWPQIEHNAEKNVLGLSERVRKGRGSWGAWVLLSPGNALPQRPLWAHPVHEPSHCCPCPLWENSCWETPVGTTDSDPGEKAQDRLSWKALMVRFRFHLKTSQFLNFYIMKLSNILKSRDHSGRDPLIQRLGIISPLPPDVTLKIYEP